MNKAKLFFVFIFFVNSSFSQTVKPEDILLRSKAACKKVKSASFDAELYFMSFSSKDTIHLKDRMNLFKTDTNRSGVIGRMVEKNRTILQFPNQQISVNNDKIIIDTIYYKNGFSIIKSDLICIGFLDEKPFEFFLSKTENTYEFLDTSSSTYFIGVNIKEDEELGDRYCVFGIDRTSLLPVLFENRVRKKSQNQFQYRNLKISNLNINDDSATYYLNNFNVKLFDTIKYTERYVQPKLLDSGTFAPNWKFPVCGIDDSVSLSQYKGIYVLMDFWFISCYPCQKAIPSLIKLQEKFQYKLVVLGMAPYDNDSQLKAFIPKNKINYRVVKCSKDFPLSTYKVSAYPTMYLLNKEGKIIKTHLGFYDDENKIENFEKEISELIKD